MGNNKKISFNDYYENLFPGRWNLIKKQLAEDPVYTFLEKGLKKSYYLDEASAQAAESLGVEPEDRVLDMCAAPGGKALILAGKLGNGMLTVNDRSAARTARLKRVLKEHLPEELFARIKITSRDASRWGLHEKNVYDKVLCDVPCSSERHVLSSPQHLASWSPKRTKRLAIEEYAILTSGITAAKPGGRILYSTCALSPLENDRVIEKAVKRWGKQIHIEEATAPWGEKTQYGWQIWPDEAGGRGPIYFARIAKLEIDGNP
jgi:5-methylcytosine rRNA methyltransferase NSUN4